MTKNKRKVIALMMAMVMVMASMFAMTTSVFAAEDGCVNVTITKNMFDENGQYTGKGEVLDDFAVDQYEVSLDELDMWVQDYALKQTIYLPWDIDDPMGGKSSVLDAISLTCIMNGIDNVEAGWDTTYLPEYNMYPGGYISNLNNYGLKPNTTTYFKGENGNTWGRSMGSGWNIAYTNENGEYVTPNGYASNVEIVSGMDIIMDVSDYNMVWDTHTPWVD